jgi:hypothetical protein
VKAILCLILMMGEIILWTVDPTTKRQFPEARSSPLRVFSLKGLGWSRGPVFDGGLARLLARRCMPTGQKPFLKVRFENAPAPLAEVNYGWAFANGDPPFE